MSEKYKKTYKYLNYVEHLLILVLTVTDCVSISAFASLVCVPVYITCSAVGIKIFAITAGIKKYKSKKHEKTVLLGKDKLNIIEVLISKALIDSYISHDEFVSVNNLFRKYNEMKIEIKNSVSCKILLRTYFMDATKNTANKNSSVRKTKQSFYQIVQCVARINQLLLKIKNLKIFQKISLKWIKSLTILLTGENFMQELHLKQWGFTYSAWGPFTKHCERIQKFIETGNLKHLYKIN